MVWIHGGSLSTGQGMGYDGTVLAGMFDVILVNINYRLDALGFLSTADEHAPGNFGILDQILALEWIKANIASFGGDPGRITIFGESAGGFSTSTLALSPRAENLFHRVIPQSGVLYYTWMEDDPVPNARKLGFDLGCNTPQNPDLEDHGQLVDCLRDIPVDDILSAQRDNDFDLVVDGEVITHPFDEFVELSNFQQYDLLVGTNSYEATLVVPPIDYPLEEGMPQLLFESYVRLIQQAYHDSNVGLVTDATLFQYTDWYNLQDDHIRLDQFVHFYNDEFFLSPAVKFSRDHAALRIPPTNPRGNTYHYYFDHRSSHLPFEDYIDGAGHGTEIVYVFGAFLVPGYNVTDEEVDLCRTMTTYWTNFAKTGDPNSPVSEDTPVKWPIFENTNEHLLHLTVNLTDDNIREKIRADYMAFWLEYVPELIALNCSESESGIINGHSDSLDDAEHDSEKHDNCYGGAQVFKLTSYQAERLILVLICQPIVDTTHGQISGYTRSEYGLDVDVFLAIPYAEPPTGINRFSAPLPKIPWAPEVLDATEFGPSCPQNFSNQAEGLVNSLPNTDIDEDCLLMNIYKPNSAENEPHAVMMWIHGGAFMFGQGMGYDGHVLAGMFDVVLVTINYRLGSFGFLSTADEHSPGNFGILDQILALEWIKANIASFGGDPDRITIFGESAGAFSTSTLALSPRAENLFHRVIGQSGALFYPWLDEDPMSTAHRLGYNAGCNTTENPDLTDHGLLVDCLRGLSLDDLLSAQAATFFNLVVDGEVITHSVEEFYELSNFQQYDTLFGTNSYKATLALSLVNNYPLEEGMSRAMFEIYVRAIQLVYFDENIPLVVDASTFQYTDWYNLEDDHIRLDQFVHLYNDEFFLAPGVHFLREHAALRIPPSNPRGVTYHYYFDHRSSYLPFEDYIDGAGHATEIPYVFGSFLIPGYNATVEEVDLCRTMTTYWTNFAKTGDPNSPETENTPVKWPLFENTNEHLLLLTVNLTDDNISEKIRADYVEFWLGYVPQLVDQNCSLELGLDPPDLPVGPLGGSEHDKKAVDCDSDSYGQVFSLSSVQAEWIIMFLMIISFLLLIAVVVLVIDKVVSISKKGKVGKCV
ncbi:uncharacterized protein LOC144435001 [Glandiceps talaboti]